jgi:antitoxin StbD
MMDHMEDLELLSIAESRKGEESVKVSLNEL